MSPDHKWAIRLILIMIFGPGGYVLAMMMHTFHGWVASVMSGISLAAMLVAAQLLIEEGRARERADRERRGR